MDQVPRGGDALALDWKGKSELRAGSKVPENIRRASIRFKVIANDIFGHSEKQHRDQRNVISRLNRIMENFGERPADQIKPAEIDQWIAETTKTVASANRYRATFSLVLREALRNGKFISNPARLVRQRHENHGRIRFLTDIGDASLRAAILKRFPEHLSASRPASDYTPRIRTFHPDAAVSLEVSDIPWQR